MFPNFFGVTTDFLESAAYTAEVLVFLSVLFGSLDN